MFNKTWFIFSDVYKVLFDLFLLCLQKYLKMKEKYNNNKTQKGVYCLFVISTSSKRQHPMEPMVMF